MSANHDSIHDLNPLIASLYDAAALGDWDEAIARAAEFWRCPSWIAQVQHPADPSPQLLATSWDAGVLGLYADHYWAIDPFFAAGARLPFGKANRGDELVDRKVLRRTEFYNDFARPHLRGVTELLGGMVALGDERVGLTGLHRAGSEFTDREQRLFQAFLPHFERALRLRARVEAAESSSAWQRQCLDLLPFGLLLLDSKGRILDGNVHAFEVVDSCDLLYVEGSSLRCRQRNDDRRLRMMLADCLHFQQGLTTSAGAIQALSSAGSAEASLIIWIVPRSPERRTVLTTAGVAFAYLFPAALGAPSEHLLAEVYRLTRAEARVVARLCSGMTIREISDTLQISLHTARNQLKSALHKVGARSQAELVARVDRGPAALCEPANPED